MVLENILIQADKLGFKLTNDLEHRRLIIKGLEKKDGYCPCRVGKEENYKCICIELREEGKCRCGLFIAKGEG